MTGKIHPALQRLREANARGDNGPAIVEQPTPEALALRAGKRTKVPGSGRKASGAEGRTVHMPVVVSPTVDEYLKSTYPVDDTGAKPKPSSRGYQVEMAVRELMELRVLKMRLIAGGMDEDAVIS
jgi:hypothetical protein